MHAPGRAGLAQSILLAVCLTAACVSPSAGARRATPVDLNAERRGETRSSVEPRRAARGEIPLEEAVRYATMEQLLADRAPMLDVISRGRGRFALRVRGRPAFAGSAAPLVVVDGVSYGDAGAELLASIAPREVARVEVLRDVSAIARYGSRGANGVLVVTLRR